MRPSLNNAQRTASLAALGGLLLSIGFCVYLADRDPGHAMLLPPWPRLGGGALFGVLGQWLPSFVHPFAFSLLTAAALAPRPKPRYGACAAWCAVNAAFEFGQLTQIAAWIDAVLHTSHLPPALTRPLADYFLRGRFDVGDLAALALGSLAAAAVLQLLKEPEADDAH